MVQMKKLIQNSPDQARKYLIENPAMAHQLLQAPDPPKTCCTLYATGRCGDLTDARSFVSATHARV